MTEPEIIDFHPTWQKDFYRLNLAWLKRYFCVEPIDEEVLSKPQQMIIEPGGQILLARIGDRIVGTAALIAHEGGRLELSKMAVEESLQGQGIGKKLAKAAISRFEQSDMQQLFLESNRRLEPAIKLYRQLGFVEVPHPEGRSHYQRADIYMVYRPEAGASV